MPAGDTYVWDSRSTYIKKPPYFDNMVDPGAPIADFHGMRVLALLGDSVTTDHISPAGSIPKDSPAGKYLIAQGVQPADFNSYGARRGNHEVMVRGTLANIRLRNQLAPGTEGRLDRASARWRADVHLRRLRALSEGRRAADDPAGKGVRLGLLARLGGEGRAAAGRQSRAGGELRAHPSHQPGRHGRAAAAVLAGRETAQSLGLSGKEVFQVDGVSAALEGSPRVKVRADSKVFEAMVRVDTPQEAEYFRHGGILPYVLRELAAQK